MEPLDFPGLTFSTTEACGDILRNNRW